MHNWSQEIEDESDDRGLCHTSHHNTRRETTLHNTTQHNTAQHSTALCGTGREISQHLLRGAPRPSSLGRSRPGTLPPLGCSGPWTAPLSPPLPLHPSHRTAGLYEQSCVMHRDMGLLGENGVRLRPAVHSHQCVGYSASQQRPPSSHLSQIA